MRKYYKYELKMSIMNILSIVLLIGPIILLSFFGFHFFDINSGLFLILMLAYLMIHELFHGIAYSLFVKDKKNIKYGIALEKGVFYAACQEKLNKKQILISLMFPLIFLSLIPFPFSLIFKSETLALLCIINFSGAIGDILMSILILRGPSDIEYLDYNTDIGAYLISKEDLKDYTSLGFKLTEYGDEKSKMIDKSIKRFSISKISCIILGVIALIAIMSFL